MTNIGLIGDISVGKTSLLRLFVKYLNKGDIKKLEGGTFCSVVKTDFGGEAAIRVPGAEKETKTIHPNLVVFRENDSQKPHTLFAPGGDRHRAVVKMSVITISRICKKIIAVFAFDRELKEQFDFFSKIRIHFPSDIHVCINKADLIESGLELEFKEWREQIKDFFNLRKIKVRDFFITCAEKIEDFKNIKDYNDRVAEMILILSRES